MIQTVGAGAPRSLSKEPLKYSFPSSCLGSEEKKVYI